jgi:hypothetical protein
MGVMYFFKEFYHWLLVGHNEAQGFGYAECDRFGSIIA